ncbi:MAG: polysaccharide deacetylase family protein [Sphingorhabdus sp.]
MTKVLITVDTEFSASRHQQGLSGQANYESSIVGRCRDGDFGIGWQMQTLAAHGLKAVFFIDPIPALVLGEDIVQTAIRYVLDRGHEVQLHVHTEWLTWAETSPVDGRQGRNIGDFSVDDQVRLLRYGCDLFERAGAPRPLAFRAGNFGADARTLTALGIAGLRFDTSVNANYLGRECRVPADPGRNLPYKHDAIVELPISGLYDWPGHFRPAQVCALSSGEMIDALKHAASTAAPAFTIVTHSFEMLSRDRQRVNRTMTARFEAMAAAIARHPNLATAGYCELGADAFPEQDEPRLGPNLLRTGWRYVEQAWATLRYERDWRPA